MKHERNRQEVLKLKCSVNAIITQLIFKANLAQEMLVKNKSKIIPEKAHV